jgi:hypothetical protein
MASIVAGRRGPSRWSSLAHLAAAAVMVVVLVPLVLKAAQASPPSLAEFAPQVQQTIRKAPPGQNSAFGSAEGGGNGAPTPTPSPTPAAAVAQATPSPLVVPPGATVRKCIGDPPRQIEDPQSPPCVPFWDPAKGNGGATWPGVTDKAITLAIPQYFLSNAGDVPTMVNFFNDRFEFYGRKLQLVAFQDAGVNATAEQMQADAAKVKTQSGGAFVEMAYPVDEGGEEIFYDALAAQPHPVISVQAAIQGLSPADQAHLAATGPYQWNYVQTPDVIQRNLVDMICRQLAGRPPSHAGAPTNAAPARKFGIVKSVRSGLPGYDDSLLSNGIQACTGQTVDHQQYTTASNTTNAEAGTAITNLDKDGVTSVICICFGGDLDADVMPAAAGQDYYPEWITSDLIDQDGNESLFLAPPNEAQHAIGIRSLNKELPLLDTPYIWAIHYESPTSPKPPYNNTQSYWDDWMYHDLLVIASGIQMAGPDLTPDTFAAALQRTQFPNPGCDGPPYYQACVGFQGGSHTMQQSFAQVWWDPRQPNPGLASNNPGAYCYADVGRRHGLGAWPAADHYGQAPCN